MEKMRKVLLNVIDIIGILKAMGISKVTPWRLEKNVAPVDNAKAVCSPVNPRFLATSL